MLVVAAVTGLVWWGLVTRIGHFDLDVFLGAGAAVRRGENPYPALGTAAVHSGHAFVYPYLTAWPFALLSWLPHADTVFLAASVLAVLGGVRLAGTRDWRVYALVIAASTTVIGLQMGTFNAWLFAALMFAWRRRDHPLTCGCAVALAIYAKVFLVPVLLWLVLAQRWRATMVALTALTVLFGVGELISPVGTGDYLGMLAQLGAQEARAGVSLTGLLANVGLPMSGANACARVAAVAVMAGCALALRRGHDERLAYAGAVVAGLLASPVVWCHYLLVLVAPLLALSTPVRRPVGLATTAPPPAPIGPTWTAVTPAALPATAAGRRWTAVGAGRPPVAGPTAVFTALTWFLVTPHRSGAADLAVTAAIGVPLVLSCLVGRDTPGTIAGRRRPTFPTVTLVASFVVAVVTLGVGASVLGATRTPSAHVGGSYAVLVGVVGFLLWAGRTTAARSATCPPVGCRGANEPHPDTHRPTTVRPVTMHPDSGAL